MKYRAFISYSHAADGRLAPAIQTGLHRFAKPWYRMSAIRTFRDQTNLSVHPKLWGQIEAALSESDYFVLLASRQSAASRWVQNEVEYWLAHRPIDQLLIVVTDGELAWDHATGDFEWNDTNPLPAILRGRFTSEPLYLKLQWAKSDEDLTLRNVRFHDAIADLAATLYGKPKDEIIGDDVRQHRRTRRYAWGAMYVLLIVAAIAGVGWWQAGRQQAAAERNAREAQTNASEAKRQQGVAEANASEARTQQARAEEQTKEADRQKRNAEEQRDVAEHERNVALARQLAAQSELVLGRQHDLALSRALASIERAPTVEGRRALVRAISWNPQAIRLVQANQPTGLAFSRDGRSLAVGRKHGVDLWDVESWRNRPLCTDEARDEVTPLAINSDGTFVAAVGGRELLVWNVSGVTPDECGPSSIAVLGRQNVTSLAFSPDGRWIAVGHGTPTSPGGVDLWQLGRKGGRIVLTRDVDRAVAVPDGQPSFVQSLASTPKSAQDLKGSGFEYPGGSPLRRIAAASNGQLAAGIDGCGVVVVLANANSPVRFEPPDGAARQLGSPDTFAAISNEGERVDIWDLQSRRTSTLRADPGWSFLAVQLRLPQRQIVVGLQGREAYSAERLQVRPLNGPGVAWELTRTEDGLLPFAVSRDGRVLAQGLSKVSIWNIDRRQRIATVTPGATADRLAFAPDGTQLAIAYADRPGRGARDADPGVVLSVETWVNLASGKPRELRSETLQPAFVDDDSFVAVRYSPDGRTVAASTLERVVLLGASRGPLNERASHFAFSADGGLIATAAAQKITVWDRSTRDRLVDVPAGSLPVTGLWFSADDRRLIYSTAEGLTVLDGPGRWRERARELLGGAQPRETCEAPK